MGNDEEMCAASLSIITLERARMMRAIVWGGSDYKFDEDKKIIIFSRKKKRCSVRIFENRNAQNFLNLRFF